MIAAIRRMPAGTHESEDRYGPVVGLDEEVRLRFKVSVDPDEALIDVDLRENPDCVPAGVNMTEATAYAGAVIGVLNSIPETIPANAGSLRRIRVQLRENCLVGIPRHPVSCAAATTTVTQRVVTGLQLAFAEFGDGCGLAAGAYGKPPTQAVISGTDGRHGGRAFVDEISIDAGGGGPGGPTQDGSITYGGPVTAGVMYPAGVELTELKHPIYVEEARFLVDSGGAGRRRGGPGMRVTYRPASGAIRAIFNLDDPERSRPGVLGGLPGSPMRAYVRRADGTLEQLAAGPQDIRVEPREGLVSETQGGGGYGPPEQREPPRVRADVEERWVSQAAAAELYRVAVDESAEPDLAATRND
jgi:N-methylhydantoinase B